MSEVVVFTTNACGYCTRVKMLLDARSIAYREVNVGRDPAAFVDLARGCPDRRGTSAAITPRL